MQNLHRYNSFYLIGIKGVAMTSIAQCLLDMGKKVQGSDLDEEFVTHHLLSTLHIPLFALNSPLPTDTDCVIYTSAHKGPDNPQVLEAKERGIPALSQAEALGYLFNEKKGIAVCGVGGKSTTSAMITWILDKTGFDPSFSVGVGNIPGLEKTGRWSEASEYFVAEADEYVIDPHAVAKGEAIVPRFSFLKPHITVCTNLAYDHPDVYRDFEHTKEVYTSFFSQLKPGGHFIYNNDNKEILPQFVIDQGISFGEDDTADIQYTYHPELSKEGVSQATIVNKLDPRPYTLNLSIPGKFNIANAVAAIAAVMSMGVDLQKAIDSLADFHSTMRRFEFIGEKNGVKYYDDYAHHPSEVKAAIQALTDWYPQQRKIIAFQSHTFSRTKELFDDFVEALATADEVILIDIFASARESFDASVSADMIVKEVKRQSLLSRMEGSNVIIENVKTIENLATTLKNSANEGDVVLTLGAGDIYKVHQLL